MEREGKLGSEFRVWKIKSVCVNGADYYLLLNVI